MEYQPERYLKDGKLNPDVVDPESVAFGFGRRSVDLPYSVMRHISHRRSALVFVLEDTSPTIRYIYLRAPFLQSMISNHQLMIRAIPSSSKPSSLVG